MKLYPAILMSLMVSVAWTSAQVTVEVLLDQKQFLRDESLPIKVRITNRSGQELRLGDDPGWLDFQVERRDGGIVSRTGQVPVEGAFTVASSQRASRLIDLMPHFDFRPGRYTIRATVRIRQWQQQVSSRPTHVEVIKGTKLWEQVVGIPTEQGPPQTRKYILQQANYLGRLHLYARLTDATERRVVKVMPLGRLPSFSHPEAQIDRQSNLHVLFQTGPRAFSYWVISPKAKLVRRERHDYGQTRPTLKGDTKGQIKVSGGLRRITRYDVPPPSAAPVVNQKKDASPPAP